MVQKYNEIKLREFIEKEMDTGKSFDGVTELLEEYFVNLGK